MCFSLEWLRQILILCVVVGGIIAILKIIVPYALSKMGATMGEGAAVIIQVLKICLWVVIAVIVIVVVFMLISCLWSLTGGMGALLPHR